MGKRDPKIPNSLGWRNPKTSQGSQNYWKTRSRGCNSVRKREKALTDPPVPLLWGRGEREKGKGINKRGNKGGKGEKRGKRENPGTHRARPSGALGGTGREEENKPGISSGIQPSLPQTAPCLWGKWGQRGWKREFWGEMSGFGAKQRHLERDSAPRPDTASDQEFCLCPSPSFPGFRYF